MKFWILLGLLVLFGLTVFVSGVIVLLPSEPELTIIHWEITKQSESGIVTNNVYIDNGLLHIEGTAPASLGNITCTVTAVGP